MALTQIPLHKLLLSLIIPWNYPFTPNFKIPHPSIFPLPLLILVSSLSFLGKYMPLPLLVLLIPFHSCSYSLSSSLTQTFPLSSPTLLFSLSTPPSNFEFFLGLIQWNNDSVVVFGRNHDSLLVIKVFII